MATTSALEAAMAEATASRAPVQRKLTTTKAEYDAARADLDARARAGKTLQGRNSKGHFTRGVKTFTAGRPALPSIFEVKQTQEGRYQPMRNGAPHFEAFDDFISAHCVAKVAEERAQARYARQLHRRASVVALSAEA